MEPCRVPHALGILSTRWSAHRPAVGRNGMSCPGSRSRGARLGSSGAGPDDGNKTAVSEDER
ncbi:hypothetical protein KCH_37060 [Kitasatospora cheerisanensis KCTC 2395]|uniref:Uncharacterized protein n=1 Tax=Kitasatospora cheerisanensis KCTC 2395 TaxID=1348663 RepID=A0A066YXA3_9ACTN|nr:hypothetical protein KCH_37060 [Kitasatospora cheerisanensis KCTC 2395]